MPKIKRINPQVLIIDHEYRSGFEQWYLLSSDRHWDNPHSDRKLQKTHLDLARKRNAKILDFGDLFCVMQGKYDRRASKTDLRAEHQVDNYLDAVVNTAVDWFSPYADMFALVAEGNHESAIRRHHETDLIERFVTTLNYKNGTELTKGLYTGYVRFRFKKANGNSRLTPVTLNFTHGYGGGGLKNASFDYVPSDQLRNYRYSVPDNYAVYVNSTTSPLPTVVPIHEQTEVKSGSSLATHV